MKRYLALVLALVLAFSVAACGKQSDTGKNPEPAQTQAPSSSASSGSNAPAPAATNPPATPAPDSGVNMETIHGAFGDYARYTTANKEDLGPVEKDALWIGQNQPVEACNPFANGATCLIDLLYDKLLEYNLETGELQGAVFKEFNMAPDNSYLEFTMYDNIVFHDGTPATAEDVFYTLQRAIDPSISQQADRNVFGNIDFEKSEITGPYSGKLVLITPTVTFLPGLTKAWLLCKSYIEKVGEENAWWENCVGSGPYKVEDAIQGDRYILTKNEQYWREGEKNTFKKIVVRGYSEAATMVMDYETHNLDVIVGASASDVDRIIAGDIPNTVLEMHSLLNTYSLVFNEEKGNPALNDENVRKAIALAIDPETVLSFSWDTLASVASSVVPSALPDSIPMVYEQNIEEAKQALKDAGYKPGEITLVMGTQNGAEQQRASETMQEMLTEVGFNVEMCVVERTVNIVNMRNAGPNTYDLAITMQAFETLESANMLGTISHANGSVSFTAASDENVDAIVMKAKAATTVADKQALMKELQQYLHDHYWIIPLVEPRHALIYRDYLTGIRLLIPRMAEYSWAEFTK